MELLMDKAAIGIRLSTYRYSNYEVHWSDSELEFSLHTPNGSILFLVVEAVSQAEYADILTMFNVKKKTQD
jgi:hypothetical protein